MVCVSPSLSVLVPWSRAWWQKVRENHGDSTVRISYKNIHIPTSSSLSIIFSFFMKGKVEQSKHLALPVPRLRRRRNASLTSQLDGGATSQYPCRMKIRWCHVRKGPQQCFLHIYSTFPRSPPPQPAVEHTWEQENVSFARGLEITMAKETALLTQDGRFVFPTLENGDLSSRDGDDGGGIGKPDVGMLLKKDEIATMEFFE